MNRLPENITKAYAKVHLTDSCLSGNEKCAFGRGRRVPNVDSSRAGISSIILRSCLVRAWCVGFFANAIANFVKLLIHFPAPIG